MDLFREDIIDGLRQIPKKLPSRYFYNEEGDALFQKIMGLEEYYLPTCEMEIISERSSEIAQDLHQYANQFEVIELGAGDGSKTAHLLESLTNHNLEIVYRPLDISPNILETNQKYINKLLPKLVVEPTDGNYFHTYPNLDRLEPNRLVLFLGGNIGNFLLEEASDFLQLISENFESNDHILIAFDMIKDPRKILAAYDDSQGVTADFNLNLLKRINTDLGANFDLSKFTHYPYFNPVNGMTYSYLISTDKQTVQLDSGESFRFDKYEPIHTEVSKKYFTHEIEYLAKESHLHLEKWYYDTGENYALVLMRKL